MKLEHLEATKCIFQLTEEEKGEWVAAAVAKESWVAGSGGNGTNEGDSGGGKKEEEEDEEEGVWGGWKQHISFCFLPCFLIVHFCGFNVFCGALFLANHRWFQQYTDVLAPSLCIRASERFNESIGPSKLFLGCSLAEHQVCNANVQQMK